MDLKTLLSPAERKIFERLTTPQKIQDYLDTLPYNFEPDGETYMSPRRTIRAKVAHCFEGALFAAAALAYHGHNPLLLDLNTTHGDDDHLVALFKKGSYWGAISKTNHAILRYRDPVYTSVRELAMSYFHEYYLLDGRKTLRSFSVPLNISKYKLDSWLTAEDDLIWLADALTDAKHTPVAPPDHIRALRRATSFEIAALDSTEWEE